MGFSRRCAENFRVVSATSGVVFGIMILMSFGFIFHNWACATWGAASGIMAGLSLAVEIINKVTRWRKYRKCLVAFALLGTIGLVLGLSGFVVYITYAAVERHPIMPYGRSFWVVSIWCCMTFKHSFSLFYASLLYFYRKSVELDPEDEAAIVT